MDPIGPLPGHDNMAVVIECGQCQGQAFRVSWIAAPVAAAPVPGFRQLTREGQRLSPRYCLECLGCGICMLAPPDGPDPLTVRGGTRNN
jgi:hypothetical protein